MNLLERRAFQEKLFGWLPAITGQEGRLVLLAGEAGVGKTVFVRAFCRAVEGNASPLIGACDRLSTPTPLSPLIDIAAAMGGSLEQLSRDDHDRTQLFQGFLSTLKRMPKPPVIIFEDVHWADEATLDLLRFLGRRIGGTRALLIATYRDDEVGAAHPLRVVIGDLATYPAVVRLSLPPLSQGAVAVLADGTGVDAAELHQRTGGNPFFVTEVLAAGADGVPVTVRDAVLARAARLPREARDVLGAAAVIGTRIEPWLLEAVFEPGEGALEACLGLGILQVQGGHYAFRHELAREAVYGELTLQRRSELHARALRALQTSPAPDLARLAHHAEAADDAEAVLRYAPEAARRAAALQAHREAAAQYARALRFSKELVAEERASLLEAWAYECYLTHRIPAALEGRQQALALWRSLGNRLKEGEMLRWLSRLAWFQGDGAEAERTAQAALAVFEGLPPGPELAMAYSNLAQLKMLRHNDYEAIVWGEKAIDLAKQLSDTAVLVHALNNVGTARLHMADEAGREQLEQSLCIAREHGLEEHAARAWTNLASMAVSNFHFALADVYLHEGITYATEHDLDAWRLYMSGWHAVSLFYQGFWNQATEVATMVSRHPSVSPVSAVQALVVLGRVRARRGDPEVWPVLDEALELALRTDELQRLGPVRCSCAEAAYFAGDMERVLEEAEATYSLAIARKEGWLAGELAYWRWKASGLLEVPGAAAQPFALQICGDWREAAEAWQRLGCPYESARALAESEDETALRDAHEQFSRLGARPAAERVAQRMRDLGLRGLPRGPRPNTLANPAQLTERELEVLALMAEGGSNLEIAAKLRRSHKTVGHHVSAVLAKLEVKNRTEAVRKAIELGMLGKS